MDFESIITGLSRSVARDPALSAWALSTYDNRVKVYEGLDGRELPSADDCPFVSISGDERTTGENSPTDVFAIAIVAMIYDADSEVYPDENIISYKGIFRVEKFRKHLARIVQNFNFGRPTIKEFTAEYNTIEIFPFMQVDIAIILNERLAIGRGSPLINE